MAMSRSRAPASRKVPARSIGWMVCPGMSCDPIFSSVAGSSGVRVSVAEPTVAASAVGSGGSATVTADPGCPDCTTALELAAGACAAAVPRSFIATLNRATTSIASQARRGSFVTDMIGSTLLVSTDSHRFAKRGSHRSPHATRLRRSPRFYRSISKSEITGCSGCARGRNKAALAIRAIVKVSRSTEEDWPDRRLPRAVRP